MKTSKEEKTSKKSSSSFRRSSKSSSTSSSSKNTSPENSKDNINRGHRSHSQETDREERHKHNHKSRSSSHHHHKSNTLHTHSKKHHHHSHHSKSEESSSGSSKKHSSRSHKSNSLHKSSRHKKVGSRSNENIQEDDIEDNSIVNTPEPVKKISFTSDGQVEVSHQNDSEETESHFDYEAVTKQLEIEEEQQKQLKASRPKAHIKGIKFQGNRGRRREIFATVGPKFIENSEKLLQNGSFNQNSSMISPDSAKKRKKAIAKVDDDSKVANRAVIVIDNGSSYTKIGIAGEDKPRFIIPSYIGYPADPESMEKDYVIGYEAIVGEGLILKQPFKLRLMKEKGKNFWKYVTDFWRELLTGENYLNLKPSLHPILVTELPEMAFDSKHQMQKIFFQEFESPCVYVANTCVMALFSQGAVSGLIVDIGNRTQIVPVIDGYPVESAKHTDKQCPALLNEYMARLMQLKGYYWGDQGSTAKEEVRLVKENMCFVTQDIDDALESPDSDHEVTYDLPTGKTVTLGHERFLCPEALFSPSKIGLEQDGIHFQIFDSINRSPIDSRKDLYANILLSGGSTQFKGFSDRLKTELSRLIPPTMRKSDICIPDVANRKYLPWFGGSLFGALETFFSNSEWRADWIEEQNNDYEE